MLDTMLESVLSANQMEESMSEMLTGNRKDILELLFSRYAVSRNVKELNQWMAVAYPDKN